MDFNFTCPFCNQELTIDEAGVGSEIECPSCAEMLIIPVPEQQASGPGTREERTLALPTSKTTTAKIVKPTARSLEVAAKLDKQLRLKTFRHHEHVKDDTDQFDEAVSAFLEKQGVDNVVSVQAIQYAPANGTTPPGVDYGVVVVYKG